MRVLAGHFVLLRRSRGSEADRQRMRSRKSIKVALLSDRENKRTVGTENGSLGGHERAKVDRLADVGRLEEETIDAGRNRFRLAEDEKSIGCQLATRFTNCAIGGVPEELQ